MAQQQNNEERFAGQFMIQDNDHMAGIPQQNEQGARQQDQSDRGAGQQGGERRKKSFDYQNPRQQY